MVTVDAVNFGSGWFPLLRKRLAPASEGGRPKSGYFTIAEGLRDHFERTGAWSPAQLRALDPAVCARVFGQDPDDPGVARFVALLWRALVELGHFLEARCGGSFEGLIEAAGGRAERLARLLAEMPLYRDVSTHEGRPVPLYKRAQITAADLALAFEGRGPGAFRDLDELTMFADNLVPHVLRCEGVLEYAPALAARIESDRLLGAGSPEEVEIRAVGLHAVERLCEALGPDAPPPRRLDSWLWTRGQAPDFKARPRHRARSVFY